MCVCVRVRVRVCVCVCIDLATVRKDILMSKNLTNLHLPRFDELKVDETQDFISACNIL